MNELEDARAIFSLFDSDRLRLARDARGWTQRHLADRTGISAAAISQFEKRQARPSPRTLLLLSKELRFPVQFFARAPIPGLTDTAGFFRSLRSTPKRERDKALARANLLRHLALTLERFLRLPELKIPTYRSFPDAEIPDIESIAVRARRDLELPKGPIAHVVRTLERHGIVTTRFALADVRIDAFSVPFPDRPVVVLGSDKENLERSRFDGVHELGHLVMHDEEACGSKWAESQAHAFAASLLMPADEIVDELPRKVDWAALAHLKTRWRVSMSALLYRAKTLQVMNETTYVRAMKVMSSRGWRRKEPVDLGPPESPSLLSKSIQLLEDSGVTMDKLADEAALSLEDFQFLVGRSRDPRPSVNI